MKLHITANKPVSQQLELTGASTPVYTGPARQLGKELRSLLLECAVGTVPAAAKLGLSVDELRGCLLGAYSFSIFEAAKLLRAR